MARTKKETIVVEENKDSPQSILSSILKNNKTEHYNDVKAVKVEKISTGSLMLDMDLGGGIDSAGLIRYVGFTEAGKSSQTLETIRNYLSVVPKSRALLVKAEGRLSQEMQDRSGLTFVWEADQWVEGTVFVLETNTYELVVEIMRNLVTNNPDNYRYVFALDSMDALILRSDLEKDVTEAGKVAGAPLLTKKFMQRLAIAMNKLGHLCIMIGQVSASIQIDPYGPKDNRQISATGGNAALHFSNWILQFEPRFKKDLIVENEKEAPNPETNKILGHWCKIIVKKSPNEKSNLHLSYPIKYGRTGGKSIWREYEVLHVLRAYELATKSGAWIKIDASLIEEMKAEGLEAKEQHQGDDNFRLYLEENPQITDWLFNRLRKLVYTR